MNRRGNGLSADTYAPLIDLTPESADAMLSALREAGIAAYASSTAEEPTADQPLDRLYVDTSMRSTAESLLHTHLSRLQKEHAPGSGTTDTGGQVERERDDEAVWAEIVASFEAVPEGDSMPWPDEENLDTAEPPGDAEPADRGDADHGRTPGEDRTGRLPTARVVEPAEPEELPPAGDEEHYIPPPPPPLPDGDAVSRAAWAALLGGPLYLVVTVLIGWAVPGWAAFLAVAAFIGGFVTLVLRMGDDPRGPDDGAIV